jgi:aspartate-semialdehyde dehydrogenase
MKAPVRVGVAGATGAVGLEMLRVMEERAFPVDFVRPLASSGRGGRTTRFGGRDLAVQELTRDALEGLDVVLFATKPAISREFAPLAVAQGTVCIDNSRAYRMEAGVPLVVPEVNPEALESHGGIIANPNCSTIQMVLALKPIHDEVGLVRVVASTYQSVSGTGLAAIRELVDQTKAVLDGAPVVSEVYPHQIGFNCIPHIDDFGEDGSSREETKMVLESRKILGLPDLRITATCVRVPAFRSHAIALNVETERSLEPEAAREILAAFPGVGVLDSPESLEYPTQVDSTGSDIVWIGRIRKDASLPNGLWMWIVADNLRKGAATNAVQIAELLIDGVSG